jgi:hypothetical protein
MNRRTPRFFLAALKSRFDRLAGAWLAARRD